ncbi:MAG: DUF3137 domain-containing protein [Alphaproteobacteria bacterium]|nr:DUF3137 domain-containing protein [Alphaproteobacteria bacterium]
MFDFRKNADYIEQKRRFDAYYNDRLLPILRQSEKARLLYLAAFGILVLLMAFFYPAILHSIWVSGFGKTNASIGIYLSLSCLVVMAFVGPIYTYKKKVKPKIMPDFADFYGSFSYEYENKIADHYLMSSDLFAEYNENIGDDYFSGSYENVKMTVAEEKLRFVKNDFRGNKINKKVFTGVCVLLEMNKNFTGRTVVLQDRGILNSFYKIKGLQNVKLEDSLFEKYFEVYADNQIEARYLLTTGFMERIIKLRDLYEGKSIQFCFQNNTLLLAVPTKQNMFEANSFFRSNINKKKIDRVFDQFYTIFSIIKLLKLNQRIGM